MPGKDHPFLFCLIETCVCPFGLSTRKPIQKYKKRYPEPKPEDRVKTVCLRVLGSTKRVNEPICESPPSTPLPPLLSSLYLPLASIHLTFSQFSKSHHPLVYHHLKIEKQSSHCVSHDPGAAMSEAGPEIDRKYLTN